MTTFLLLASMLSIAGPEQTKGWRGIVPLHSTRADVETLLGRGTYHCRCGYFLDDANVFFDYSSGGCKSGGGWDVPPDTVLRITVYRKPTQRLSDLKIDERKFKKRQGGDVEGLLEYYNDDEGVTLTVYEGMVQGIYYGPMAADRRLRCP